MKKKIFAIVQILLALGLVGYFLHKIQAEGRLDKFAEAFKAAAGNWQLVILGLSMFLISILLCTARWRMLLKAQQVNLSYGQTLTLYFIGHFFSAVMPGATSGDIFKAVYIAREAPDKKAEVVATVFLDRVIGLLAMLFLAVVIMLFRIDFFLKYRETKVAMFFFVLVLLATVGMCVLIFGQNVFERWTLFRKIEEKTKLGEILKKAYGAFHICLNHFGLLAKTFSLSVVNHITFILCAVFLGKAIGIEIGVASYFVVFPIINTVASLPITPGGLGTRDFACVFLLGTFGVAEHMALSLSILVYLAILFWSLVGGVVYVIYSARMGKPAIPDQAA
jgi:uncharacterized protein (TIRG00374 family)